MIGNPVCTTEMPFKNGMLWKPKSDPSSWVPEKLVVLIDPSFEKQFDICEAELKKSRVLSNIVELKFFGFSNGDRQTWRAFHEGSKFIDDGYIRCIGEGQICTWRFQGSSAERHE
jgi:hypothetical protein